MSLTNTLRPLSLLFISSFLLMCSHGLSGILLPIRLANEQVGIQSIGFILSMYSVGFLLGAIIGKRVLRHIGLVRTFAMCGSLGASAILVMGLSSEIWLWAIMRAVMGFCIACATATLDTWLNSVSTESNRGKVLAVNQIVILSAITLGQFGLALAPPNTATLFILCGVFFSLSVSPVVFVSHYEPEIEQAEAISFKDIYLLSPLGFMTCLVCGILYSTIANMLPVYADGQGITGFQLSVFMGAATAGGIILQLPIGYLSDKFERRKVILSGCFVLAVTSFALPVSMLYQMEIAPLVLVSITMGLIACLYPLSISETFDRALKAQLVPVLSGLLCLYAIGSIIGPYSAAIIMERFDDNALFAFLIFVDLSLIIFTICHMSVRKALPVEEQESFVMHTPASIHEELDPRTEYHQHSLYVEEAIAQVQDIAKQHPNKAIVFIKELVKKDPEWAASLAEKASQIDEIDTVTLFRTLTLTNQDLAISIAKQIAESDPNNIQEIVDWLITKEPENYMTVLATIAEAPGIQSSLVLTPLAEHNPERVVEFTQEYVSSLIESNQEQRLADRDEDKVIDSLEEYVQTAASKIPEHANDVAQVVEDSLHKELS